MRTILTLFALLSFSVNAQNLTILHVNDTHSHIEPERSGRDKGNGGVIERAAIIDSIRTTNGKKNVLLVHAGDFSQGTSYFTVLKGDLEVDIINSMRYDCVTIGNHEFDNDMDELARRIRNIKCPVVCANYDWGNEKPGKYIKPYTIIKRAGKRIGIVGMLVDIKTCVAAPIASKITKLDNAEVLNKWARFLKEEKHCDLVICLSHLGFDVDMRLIPSIRNVDLFIGGHSHTFLKEIKYATDLDGRQIPVVQDGCWGLSLGELTCKF
ncbi:MAG: metallophosphoesterase [Bacteroidales bacterium]|nr:metallophosphoesterase [Bacteroidales bacterium]